MVVFSCLTGLDALISMCCKNSSHLKSELVELTFVNMSLICFLIMLFHIFSTLLQPLLENTKEKLSQFCHVPVSFLIIFFLFDLCFID